MPDKNYTLEQIISIFKKFNSGQVQGNIYFPSIEFGGPYPHFRFASTLGITYNVSKCSDDAYIYPDASPGENDYFLVCQTVGVFEELRGCRKINKLQNSR